jgi:hypothetical protein
MFSIYTGNQRIQDLPVHVSYGCTDGSLCIMELNFHRQGIVCYVHQQIFVFQISKHDELLLPVCSVQDMRNINNGAVF